MDLFEFTESLDEFENELEQTLDDPEIESLERQINELDEQEVNLINFHPLNSIII